MRRYVIYTRVSTAEQGKSGLGLDAQDRDIDIYLNTFSEVPWEVVGKFCDIQSGKDDDRPQLRAALALAKRPKPNFSWPSWTGSVETLSSSLRR